jgi:hypothetical protein
MTPRRARSGRQAAIFGTRGLGIFSIPRLGLWPVDACQCSSYFVSMTIAAPNNYALSPVLRDSRWAAALFGYEMPRQRSSFFQFVYSNRVPYVRAGRRKILFCEAAVHDFLQRRSTGPLLGGKMGGGQ